MAVILATLRARGGGLARVSTNAFPAELFRHYHFHSSAATGNALYRERAADLLSPFAHAHQPQRFFLAASSRRAFGPEDGGARSAFDELRRVFIAFGAPRAHSDNQGNCASSGRWLPLLFQRPLRLRCNQSLLRLIQPTQATVACLSAPSACAQSAAFVECFIEEDSHRSRNPIKQRLPALNCITDADIHLTTRVFLSCGATSSRATPAGGCPKCLDIFKAQSAHFRIAGRA
jgi:hypothetical protein